MDRNWLERRVKPFYMKGTAGVKSKMDTKLDMLSKE